ncbi:hypothetical protein D3C85_1516560 [compost metagenome]
MSGTYGHEARNLENSKKIYSQSWAMKVDIDQVSVEALATGYSCRSQAKRLSQQTLRHPLQALAEHLRSTSPTRCP